MLSKIKPANMAPETRSMSHASSNSSASSNNNSTSNHPHRPPPSSSPQSSSRPSSSPPVSDVEEETEARSSNNNNNDTNNNNSDNIDNNQQAKKSQDELLDIVENSRKRRLSKDSADSLTGFIRWSFSHLETPISLPGDLAGLKDDAASNDEAEDDADLSWIGSDDRLGNNNNLRDHLQQVHLQHQQRLLRQQALKLAASGSQQQNATNLSFSNKDLHQRSLGALLSNETALSHLQARINKRQRVLSPASGIESKHALLSPLADRRRPSSHLGSVVDRLHQQQQNQRPPSQMDDDLGAVDLDQDANSSGGLSHHLQQFLRQQQQQSSMEDLVASAAGQTGLENGAGQNQQLALVAAIHRALVDSSGPNQQHNHNNNHHHYNPLNGSGDVKSTGSSTNSSSHASALVAAADGHSFGSNSQEQAAAANLHLVESLNRQRRVYNTRAALHGLGAASGNRQSAAAAAAAAAMSLNHRMQQQRHAQAAAALSALASAGTHHSAFASAASHLVGGTGPAGLHHHHHQGSMSAAAAAAALQQVNPSAMVEFKCDTCPSSFDDRHRLMQHQSIHLELKKDWFTETPVDEVMKIFNRRRGEFLCNICNLRFEATLDYDQHNHQVHGPRPYCCQFCGNGTRTFKCWRQYLNHLYDHRYIFSCNIDDCDFTVNRRDSLRFHIFRFHLNCQLPQGQGGQQLRSMI